MRDPDILVIGAGVVGVTIALELKKRFPDLTIQIIEKESIAGFHASGRNSGVLNAVTPAFSCSLPIGVFGREDDIYLKISGLSKL